jgi:hypothetical protein
MLDEVSTYEKMYKKIILLALACLSLLPLLLSGQFVSSASDQYARLTSKESQIVTQINGADAYNYDLELEKIALKWPAFRAAGSAGANEAGEWIKEKFESFGLNASLEPFNFTTWNLLSKPSLVIDVDGNLSPISSFQCEHYSWPTPEGGAFSDLVVLPLPEARSRENFGTWKLYNASAWIAVNTTGKILLIGREVRWDDSLYRVYRQKLTVEPPAAVIYTWWYDWMNFTPPMFSSIGGRPASDVGPFYWNLRIPVGWVSHEDGLYIRNIAESMNASAHVTIPSVIGYGPNYNVVARLEGSVNPEKMIIISGHYDTVMTPGFCDNGAGVSGVIELARVFAAAAKEGKYRPEQTLLFIAFTGEELVFAGSINYIKQHEAEMKNITAVINLDCIGNNLFAVTDTFPDGGLDLEAIVLRAAEDLGIEAQTEEPGGSDQEAFRSPMVANSLLYQFWKVDAGITNATRVKASILFESWPLFYSDKWTNVTNWTPGWIHTEYDNSTSTTTLNWVKKDNLERHIQIAALSVMRVLSNIYSPFLSQVLTVTAVAGIIAAVAMYFERRRVSTALKKIYDNIFDYMGTRELLYIIMLTALFLFISFAAYMRIGKMEVMEQGVPTTVSISYFGYPFEMIGVAYPTELATGRSELTAIQLAVNYRGGTMILWNGLFLNIVVCFLLAFAVTYTVMRLNRAREASEV